MFLTLATGPGHASSGLEDDRGKRLPAGFVAKRIISLTPHLTETVFSAGAGDRLVGVSSYSDFPEAARALPGVGDADRLDLEKIIMLEPDLVIAWHGSNQAGIRKLEKLGIRVFVTRAERLEDISRLLRITGKLAGTRIPADQAADAFDTALLQARARYANRTPVSVFQMIWHQPLMTVNGSHIINDIIRICGGINIFAAATLVTPAVSAKDLLSANPKVIIDSSTTGSRAGLPVWQRQLKSVDAVIHNRILPIHPDLIHRPTPRVLQAVETLCTYLEKVRSGQEI